VSLEFPAPQMFVRPPRYCY